MVVDGLPRNQCHKTDCEARHGESTMADEFSVFARIGQTQRINPPVTGDWEVKLISYQTIASNQFTVTGYFTCSLCESIKVFETHDRVLATTQRSRQAVYAEGSLWRRILFSVFDSVKFDYVKIGMQTTTRTNYTHEVTNLPQAWVELQF